MFDANKESHGIDRAVVTDEYISIGTSKFGQDHGLYIAIGVHFVCVTLDQDDEELADFKFTYDFVEFHRNDPRGYFADLSAEDFRPDMQYAREPQEDQAAEQPYQENEDTAQGFVADTEGEPVCVYD